MQRRLDLVGLDADGESHTVVEVNRVNNDVRRAVPDGYEQIAACEPVDAL
ncbi:hypothetical protein [Haloarcula nitratireducens]|uniref:Uncharacterized protein n=1 Tax=Haloarcula nitratireducens TaxID=2487749 RepID=A0AAW4PFL7_9EURY|nr:hypothetical protein [Halomicroarcula nitratireducens]MBX0297201.1 hypothetical protein [Halomicroarcula nitratireducens]